MPRVHKVKKARKANKDAGIKKGDTYYWWKFRNGGKRVSKTFPKPSQLTQSEYLSTIRGIQEALDDSGASDKESMESLAGDLENAAEEVRQLGSECQDKASNMENAFPNGNPTIELLNQRSEDCDRIADELDSAANEAQSKASEGEEEKDFDWGDAASEVVGSIDWSTE